MADKNRGEKMARWMRTRKVSEEKENGNKARIRTMNKRRRYQWEKNKSQKKKKWDEGRRSNVIRIMIKQTEN
jgi:hypothetical protein